MARKVFIEIFITFVTIVAMAVGVFAITNSKSTNFDLGVKYDPAFLFKVDLTLDTNNDGTAETYEIFNSSAPAGVEYNAYYINSVTNNTIYLTPENLQPQYNQTISLTFTNLGESTIQALVNKEQYVSNGLANGESQKLEIEVGETSVGLYLLDIKIVEYSPVTLTYSLTNVSKIKAPKIISNPNNPTQIILQAKNEDFTKWTITATPSATLNIEYDYLSSLTRAIVNITNPSADSITLTATAEIDYWDGTSATAPYFYEAEGAGTTEENPYLIRTGAQFNNIRNLDRSGKYFKMMNNIYLNEGNVIDNNGDLIEGTYNEWVPFSNEGNFNGNNFYVSGVYINNNEREQGLFGWSRGYIKNLGVINSYIKANGYSGVVYASGEPVVMQNCYSKATIISIGTYVGGLIGHNRGTIIDCWNAGKVIGNSVVGGICGVMNTQNNGPAKIYNCYNIGSVSGVTNVGGICGEMWDVADTTNNPIIQNCYNFGTVTLSSGTSTLIGGVVGKNGNNSTHIGGTVQDCYYWSAFNSTGVGFNDNGTVTNVVGVSTSNYATAMTTLNANATANGWRQWQILPNGLPSFV